MKDELASVPKKSTFDGYVPYGPEWQKYMLTLPKKAIIELVAEMLTKDKARIKDLESLSKIEEGMGWIPVSERLPELHQMVALVHIIDRWWATGRDEAVNRYDAGYLNEFGEKYWAIRGHRALAINSYTHWMPLPTPPDTQQP